ncbi:Imm58 family immunity protein [Enterovibrio norvegicus]|uniref:Imm58 family immunity protein n=2 Tax=Enterovibrio norvegicus TaxID=188144 RepID=A0A2N7L4N6_9GAMM|nr:hypothetical protein [Enterovibrio norvegicus]MCC4797125.1 hypothetical protein [Enterovibrio norvegicus]OEE65647.1 hypothetical protein A1OS_13245 [Enterovibrio norvegicus]OEF58184.1 hypothetical protein A1OU_08300 [Enterovibrio norvegicus]OEF65009.1 hypothetical protein A1OW_16290 [Enterovibrio norvegicus]PMI31353.1 hypothetical protein BCU47_16280 [Enterovibrio norvegicus]
MKKSTVILLLLLIVSNVTWGAMFFYRTVDSGISLTHLQSSNDRKSSQLEIAMFTANHGLIGMPVEEAFEVIVTESNEEDPFIKSGCLNAGNMCLKIGSARTIVGIKQ